MNDERDPARARGAAMRDTSDERIRECMRLMCIGQWRAGATHAELAARWGVTVATVSGYATNASRLLRMLVGTSDEAKQEIYAFLGHVRSLAVERQSATKDGVLYDDPDLKAAVAAAKTQAELLGLTSKTVKVEVAPQYANLSTPEAKLRAIEDQIARLHDARKRLLEEMGIVEAQVPELPAKGDSDGRR